MTKIAATALAAVLFTGCTTPTPPGEAVRANGSRLVGGAADTGDPAVVVFETTGDQGGDCTAEFISTTVLLTAAHCALTENGGPLTGSTYRIYMGNDISQAQDSDWIIIDPANVHPNPAYNGDDNDITVLVLSAPVAVTPYAYNTAPLDASIVGKSAHLIGYGSNQQGPAADGPGDGFGIKRQLTTTVDDIETPGYVHIGATGANGCDGDSGGPAIVDIGGVPTIIGLDSYDDEDIDCTGGDYYQRTDTQAAFIAQYVTATPAVDAGAPATGDDAGATPAPSSSTPSDGTHAEDDAGTGSADTTSSSAAASGCATAPSRHGAGGVAPWLAVLGLVAVRRRKSR